MLLLIFMLLCKMTLNPVYLVNSYLYFKAQTFQHFKHLCQMFQLKKITSYSLFTPTPNPCWGSELLTVTVQFYQCVSLNVITLRCSLSPTPGTVSLFNLITSTTSRNYLVWDPSNPPDPKICESRHLSLLFRDDIPVRSTVLGT